MTENPFISNCNETLSVQPADYLSGLATLAGDKSLTHRALLFSALAEGTSFVGNCLLAEVTIVMLDCLKLLGIQYEVSPTGNSSADLTIKGCGLKGFAPPDTVLDCQGSGTTLRLLAGILAAQDFESTLDGHSGLRARPMRRLIEPLTAKGARISSNNGAPPLHFSPSVLHASEHSLKVASAQVKSALLFAGLYSAGETTVIEPMASRDHTERILTQMGIPLEEEFIGTKHLVRMQGPAKSIPTLDFNIPCDPSSAAFLAVAALIVKNGNVRIPNLCLNPGRTGIFEVLKDMGADIDISDKGNSHGEPTGTVNARSCKLAGTAVHGTIVPRMIDEFPILAVAATQAEGATIVKDAAELRFKESDRIEALAEELNKMGAGIQTLPDGFVVPGSTRLKGTEVNARGDHRLAMSLTVAGLVADGPTKIRGWQVLHDSFPDFPLIMNRLGASVK